MAFRFTGFADEAGKPLKDQIDATKRAGVDLMLQSSFNGVADPIEPIGFIYLPDAFYNYDGFSDPIVTSAIKEIQRTFDAEKRAQLFVEAQKIYEADNAVIPLVNTYTTSFLNNGYTGLVTSWAYWAMPSMAFIGAK